MPSWTPPEEALVLACLASRSVEEESRLAFLLSLLREDGWKDFGDLARLNRVEVFAFKALAFAPKAPTELRASLEEATSKVARENSERVVKGLPVLRDLEAAGARVLVLKGNAIAQSVYGDPGYKKMNDIDLLVRKDALARVRQVFRDHGLLAAASLEGDDGSKQEKYSHHWPPHFTPDLGCVFGTHWDLVSPLTPYRLDVAGLWSRARELDFHGLRCLRLGSEDFLHHLLLHLPRYKTGLKELADIFNLVRAESVDEALLKKLIEKAGTWEPVYHSARLTSTLVPSPLLSAIADFARPQVPESSRRETDLKVSRPARLIRSRSTHISRIERAYALFTLSQAPVEKAAFLGKMWKHFLAPPPEELSRIQYLDDPEGVALALAYLKNPAYLSKVFAHDFGWKGYLLVLLNHHVVLTKSALSFARDRVLKGAEEARRSHPGLLEVLAARGIPASKIEKLEAVLE
jgi:hypothetical protein